MSNKLYDAFDSIKAGEDIKALTRQKISEEMERKTSWGGPAIKVLAACAMICLIIGFGGYYRLSITPVSYVSIDVNPSIEITLNRWDKVIKATAYNDDGEKILETLSLKHMNYKDAVDSIVESDAMRPYLKKDADLTFSVASENSKKEEQICQEIASCKTCNRYAGTSQCVEEETISEAHENGMSFGKYAAYQELSELDDTVSVEECKEMTMAEIHSKIKDCEKNENHQKKEDNQKNEDNLNQQKHQNQQTNDKNKDNQNNQSHKKEHGHHNN